MDQQLLLFGQVLTHVLLFDTVTKRWKSERVVGTPPTINTFVALTVGSSILVYGGNDGGCKQLVWTLKRLSEASVWYWTQVPTLAIEPEAFALRTTALLGSNLYMRGLIPRPNPYHGTTRNCGTWT